MKPVVVHVLLGTLVLTGCSDTDADRAARPAASPHTVAYLLAHPDEHESIRRQCKNDPGALRNTTDCINVDQAQKQIFVWGREEAVRRSKEGF